jgi:hypothetical protein
VKENQGRDFVTPKKSSELTSPRNLILNKTKNSSALISQVLQDSTTTFSNTDSKDSLKLKVV